MKLSVTKYHPFFNEAALTGGYRVFLNGKELSNCHTASEEDAYALIWDMEWAEQHDNFALPSRMVEGRVEIRWMGAGPDPLRH